VQAVLEMGGRRGRRGLSREVVKVDGRLSDEKEKKDNTRCFANSAFKIHTVHSTAAANSRSALRTPGPLSASENRSWTLELSSSRAARAWSIGWKKKKRKKTDRFLSLF